MSSDGRDHRHPGTSIAAMEWDETITVTRDPEPEKNKKQTAQIENCIQDTKAQLGMRIAGIH